MKKISLLFVIVFISGLCIPVSSVRAENREGAADFKKFCAVCHPDGGNIMNPKKTLHLKDRDSHNIKTKADIVKLMRKPGPGMSTFDSKTISDAAATEIAEYVINTFK